MKHILIAFILVTCAIELYAQNEDLLEKVVITHKNKKTKIHVNKKGELYVNVSPKDIVTFKSDGLVRYRDFGARGNGKTDDIDAIAATHAFANQHGLMVKADDGATYYIGGKERTAIIQTDTDFGSATFIIDDTDVQNRQAAIFSVSSNLKSFKLKSIDRLSRNQEKIYISLLGTCLIRVANSDIKHYIRFGLNPTKGSSQSDI